MGVVPHLFQVLGGSSILRVIEVHTKLLIGSPLVFKNSSPLAKDFRDIWPVLHGGNTDDPPQNWSLAGEERRDWNIGYW